MAEHDWRQLLDDPDVTDVVHRAWWKASRGIYANAPLALDDLDSWMWEKAADIARQYDTSVMTHKDLLDPHAHWLAFLWKGLTHFGLKAHRAMWYGNPGSSRRHITTGLQSIDANQDARAKGEGVVTDLFGNRRLQAADPLAIILMLERIEEEIAGPYASDYSTHNVPPTGMCNHPGCSEPARRRNGRLCSVHQRIQREHNAPNCTTDGCTRPATARGLCGAHYARWRKAQMPPCTHPDCDKPQTAKGLCDWHARQARP